MLSINVKMVGLDAVTASIANLQKQTRFATALALTRTAKAVKDGMPTVMERELDRPTTFSTRGLYVKGASPARLVAEVGFMDRQASYLKYQIAGGSRTPTARGIKLPGNITLNSFGNIPRGTIDKLKAAAESGQLSKAIGKRLGVGNRRKGAAPIQLFYGKPTGRGREKAPMGIWRRVSGSPGKLIPVVVFEDKPVKYKPRFKFYEAAASIVLREWDRQFALAFAEAMRSAK